MVIIRVFHSHIEVYPYQSGDQPKLEKFLSKWVASRYEWKPVAFYINSDILYLPRGINLSYLQEIFHSEPIVMSEYSKYQKISKGHMLAKPKGKIEEDAIDFLCGEGNFTMSRFNSQLSLNLDQGDGKTFSTIAAIVKLKIKSIIILHQRKIKTQWIESFQNMTTIPKENLIDIQGSDGIEKIMDGTISGDVYFITHQTIATYARDHGWDKIKVFFEKLKVGIKVIDEAHYFFTNTVMVDCFSNVYKTFYVTATFTRGDAQEMYVFKRAFSTVYCFGKETLSYDEKRKHVNMIIVYFHSYPKPGDIDRISTGYGFSSYNYFNYEIHESNNTMIKVLWKCMKMIENLNGKVLITSPKIDTVEDMAKLMREWYPEKTVGTIHSRNSASTNEESASCDIISSTVKSSGTGVDIKGLRCLINLEPIGNAALADQVRGRLREYSKEDDTYLIYPVDMSVPDTYKFLKRILPTMKKKCKNIITYKMDDI